MATAASVSETVVATVIRVGVGIGAAVVAAAPWWWPGSDQCTATMPRFITATTHHARGGPAVHSSRAQKRHATIIATTSTATTGLPAWPSISPCTVAEPTATSAHARRPRTADVRAVDMTQLSQQCGFDATGVFNAGLRSKNPTGFSLNRA